MTTRRSARIGTLSLAVFVVTTAGCASDESTRSTETVAAQKENNTPQQGPSLTSTFPTPDDDAAERAWVRQNLDLYVDAYQSCRDDPLAITNGVPDALAGALRGQRNGHAPYVVWHGCMDGTARYPLPIPELAYLEPNR